MIIWIASYPKSGNTWIRSLLSAYFFSNDGKFNFELLKNIEQFSSKNIFSKSNNKNVDQLEIFKNWIPSQKVINKDTKIHFLKTHNALCTIEGNKFTDQNNTAAAIYIVRDPRNVITSISNHYSLNLDQAFDFLTNKKKIIFPESLMETKKFSSEYYDVNVLGDWSGHYMSWKNINFCPVKIIKYEDILTDVHTVFISILKFLSQFIEIKIEKGKIKQSIKSTSFKTLSEMEKKQGFIESSASPKTNKKVKFFNLGKENNWKKLLDNKTIQKINNAFKKEMIELNYL